VDLELGDNKFTFMKRIFLFFLVFPHLIWGQYDPKQDAYRHFSIAAKGDTINYHIYAKGELQTKKGFILFLQGSGAQPLLRIVTKTDTIRITDQGKEKKQLQRSSMLYSSIPFDLDKIPEQYAFVVISKAGFPFMVKSNDFIIPSKYYQTESLDYRVWQANAVINEMFKKQIPDAQKAIVIGHSEGSGVAAKLGTINKKITHIGFWAGNAVSQYYDFAISIRKDVITGKLSEAAGKQQLEALFTQIKKIENDPANTEQNWLGNSYRRWASFTEPPIDNLLKIDIPIFVAVAAKDNSVPIESSLLIPIEFIRHKKNNLTFKLYPDYDHSFNKQPATQAEAVSFEFMSVFQELMEWAEK
jgi:esterase/lipase